MRLALAHSCLWSKQYQCVMDVYHEILTLNSESAEADMMAGEALDEMKDNEGSTKMFRAAVTANPKEPNVHFGLGYLLWTQKIYPEAAPNSRLNWPMIRSHVQALVYLARHVNPTEPVRRCQTDSSRRRCELDPCAVAGPSRSGHHPERCRGQRGRPPRTALAEKLNPNDVNVHWRLGRLYRSMGRKHEAKAEFDKASTLNKAADEALNKKISGAHPRPPADAVTPAIPAPHAIPAPQ